PCLPQPALGFAGMALPPAWPPMPPAPPPDAPPLDPPLADVPPGALPPVAPIPPEPATEGEPPAPKGTAPPLDPPAALEGAPLDAVVPPAPVVPEDPACPGEPPFSAPWSPAGALEPHPTTGPTSRAVSASRLFGMTVTRACLGSFPFRFPSRSSPASSSCRGWRR